MALNFFPLLFTIISFALLFNFSATPGGGGNGVRAIPGGWDPIEDLNDPTVVEIATFAVNEHNKEANEKLVFQKVLKAEREVVGGLNYKLVIVAVRRGETSTTSKYEVVVHDDPWNHVRAVRQLMSFNKV